MCAKYSKDLKMNMTTPSVDRKLFTIVSLVHGAPRPGVSGPTSMARVDSEYEVLSLSPHGIVTYTEYELVIELSPHGERRP